jgi:hypothetical protein
MMKKILLAILFLLTLNSQTFAINWSSQAETAGAYNIETGSGTTFYDQSSNEHDGTCESGAWDSDVPDSGDGFEGTSTYSLKFILSNANISDDDDFDFTDSMTLGAWVGSDDTHTGMGDEVIIDKYTASTDGYKLAFETTADDYYILIDLDGTPTTCYTTGISFSANTWHYLTATFDGSNLRIYWDGSLENTCTASGSITTSTDNIRIGQNLSGGNCYFGSIDEILFSYDALDLTDINDIMTNGLVQAETATGQIIFSNFF